MRGSVGVGCWLSLWSFFGGLVEFLWGLLGLLSAGSSRQSRPGSPCLRMKVRAVRMGGEGLFHAPS